MKGHWSAAALLLSIVTSLPAYGSTNLLVIAHDANWMVGPEFAAWIQIRENLDWFHEADRNFDHEVLYYSGQDTTYLKQYIATRKQQCEGPLMVLLVGDWKAHRRL